MLFFGNSKLSSLRIIRNTKTQIQISSIFFLLLQKLQLLRYLQYKKNLDTEPGLLIFQNTSRTTIFLKNHGHSFLRSIKSIVRSKERRERNMISVRVGTGENCILSPKRARFSVRVNIFVKDIINFHKKGIWDLNLQFLLKQLLKLVWLQKVYSFQNLSATFFPLWELPSPFLTFFKEQLFIKLVTCRIHHFWSLVFGSIFWWVLF